MSRALPFDCPHSWQEKRKVIVKNGRLAVVVNNADKNQKSQGQQSVENYQSWDPLTQAKFIYEINLQAGTPTTASDAYVVAVKATIPILEGTFPEP
jgi:hypothetical protein